MCPTPSLIHIFHLEGNYDLVGRQIINRFQDPVINTMGKPGRVLVM